MPGDTKGNYYNHTLAQSKLQFEIFFFFFNDNI